MGTKDETTTPPTPDQLGTTQVGTNGNVDATRRDPAMSEDATTRAMQQGDRTDKAMPPGTQPLEHEQRPVTERR